MNASNTHEPKAVYKLPCGHEGCTQVFTFETNTFAHCEQVYVAAEGQGWVRMEPPDLARHRFVMCPEHGGECF